MFVCRIFSILFISGNEIEHSGKDVESKLAFGRKQMFTIPFRRDVVDSLLMDKAPRSNGQSIVGDGV